MRVDASKHSNFSESPKLILQPDQAAVESGRDMTSKPDYFLD